MPSRGRHEMITWSCISTQGAWEAHLKRGFFPRKLPMECSSAEDATSLSHPYSLPSASRFANCIAVCTMGYTSGMVE